MEKRWGMGVRCLYVSKVGIIITRGSPFPCVLIAVSWTEIYFTVNGG
jgi:hypothetical protein